MKNTRYTLTALIMILTLLTSLSAGTSRAEGFDDERPIRLFADAGFGPIGLVNSLGRMTINGRQTQGEQFIWGGELLQAPANMSITLMFDAIGRVTLKEGTIARFSKTRTLLEDRSAGNLLVASLVRGNMTVKLQDGAGAYVEASGVKFTATRGANFRLGVGEGQPVMETISGEVKAEAQAAQRKLNINPLDDRNRPVGNGAVLQVRLRTTREIPWQVTDENGKPVPDIQILVVLSSTNLGSVGSGVATFTATTGANGIATVPFSGTLAGSTPVTGQITGTQFAWTGQVNWVKPPISPLAKAGIAAGAAAGAGVGIILANGGDDKKNNPGLGNGNVTIKP